MPLNPDTPSDWIPISNLVDLAHLGKLGEELGEAVKILNRCLIQGMDGADPDEGTINRVELAKELADVRAQIELCAQRFQFDQLMMLEREERKKAHKRAWHKLLEKHVNGSNRTK